MNKKEGKSNPNSWHSFGKIQLFDVKHDHFLQSRMKKTTGDLL